ncbi:uncharacterized protein EI90DRAFT_2897237, partial [Cantharellus anzutake]|uniref:uncharacterized protein n=1 Tax=Cantharellus anzutake TaxID=1750568 RepID=UPI001907D136
SIRFITPRPCYQCITSSISTWFARGEEKCLVNCVGCFLDTSLHMVNRLEANR